VAIGAFHVRVHALQRKGGAPVVIEERGFPLGAVVALGARRHVSPCELLAVRIFVALLALFGRSFKVDVHHRGFEVRRLVAIDARGGAMRAQQRKSSFRVIELGQLLPRFCGMASLATAGASRRLGLLHALIELSIVRIGVATGATQIRPVIDRGRRLQLGGLSVTISARHRDVLAGQKEARLFMARQRERRRTVSLEGMATFARIQIWLCSELPCVFVFMAVSAVLEFHFENSVDTAGDVAFLASDFRVSPLQRICGCRVIRDGER